MKAMVFAAGVGSRLKPWTDSHPKALVPVGGVPVLERVIIKLKESGVRNMVVNVHHFADQIEQFLKSADNFGIDIIVSDERSLLLDTGGGLLKAAHLLEGSEPIMLHNADILTDFSIEDMLTAHQASGADATLLAQNRKSSRCLYFDSEGIMHGWGNLITGVLRPESLDTADLSPMAFGGVHIINPQTLLPALEAYASDKVFSITDFYIDSCATLKLKAYTPKGEFGWFDVGRPDTLALADAYLSRRNY